MPLFKTSSFGNWLERYGWLLFWLLIHLLVFRLLPSYGVLSVGKSGMIGVPPEVIDVVSALIIFFVGANYIIRYWVRPRQKSVKAKGGQN